MGGEGFMEMARQSLANNRAELHARKKVRRKSSIRKRHPLLSDRTISHEEKLQIIAHIREDARRIKRKRWIATILGTVLVAWALYAFFDQVVFRPLQNPTIQR